MTRSLFSLSPVLVFSLMFSLMSAGGCGKDAATKMCLEDSKKLETAMKAEDNAAMELAGSTYQSCGIACDVTKDEDACAAYKTVTEAICTKSGKEACAKLCESDGGEKNEHACAKLKSL